MILLQKALLCNLMVMLIASIVSLVLLATIYTLIIVGGFRLKKNTYELITGSPRWVKVMGNVFIWIGALMVGSSFLNIQHPIVISFLILGDFTAVMGLMFFYFFTMQFEAIKGDSVFIRRFIRIKEIKIKDIAFINAVYAGYVFACKDGTVFTVSSKTLKVSELIKMIGERMKKNDPIDSDRPVFEGEETPFSEVGKQVRAMIPSMKKNSKHLMRSMAVIIIVAMTFLAVFAFTTSNKFLMIFAIVGGLGISIPIILITPAMDKRYDNDLKQDDEYLGKKYLLLSKDVKGAAKRRFKSTLTGCIVAASCLTFVAVISGLISSFQKPVETEDLVYVTGEFEYVRRVSDDYAIGLKGNPVEYRIGSIELNETDRSFKEELHAGDTIYLYVDGTRENASISYQDKTAWNYAYVLKTDSKTYLTFEGYLRANESNRRLGFLMCYICSGVAALSLGAIVVAYAKYKSDAKKERIEL